MPEKPEYEFFISHSHADNDWAAWIAWQLEDAGYRTILDLWDFAVGNRFTKKMEEAHAASRRTIAVLSNDYFSSECADHEWDGRWNQDRSGKKSLLIPIVVRPCEVPQLRQATIRLDLVNRDEQTARTLLLSSLPPDVRKSKTRRKNQQSKPLFPGSAPAAVKKPVIRDYHLVELPPEQQFEGANDELYSIAFSRDGNWMAAGSVKRVLLWDRTKPKFPKRLAGHDSFVYAAAFSDDSRLLATGCEDNYVRVWDVKKRTLLWEMKNHEDAVYSVAFSHDCKYLASGSYDESVMIWEVSSGQFKKSYTKELGRITSVAFAPDDSAVAFGSLDNSIRLWDLNTDKVRKIGSHFSSVEGIAFSPDGDKLASCGLDKFVRVWNLDGSKKKIWAKQQHKYLVRSVAFSPDGGTLASAGWDKMAYLWNAETGEVIKQLPFDLDKPWHKDWIWSIAFSPDGSTLASSGSDGKVILWRVNSSNGARHS